MPLIKTDAGVKLSQRGTGILRRNAESRARIIVNRGGTRSSKTYSLCQLFIMRLMLCHNRRMLIARKTFPALRVTVMHDMIEILKEEGLYHLVRHNKTEHTLRYGSNEIVFSSIDDAQKVRGAGWNDVWFNEGNEMLFEDHRQVILRLSRPETDGLPNQHFIDFNPDDDESWIKTELEDRGRCEVIVSTYRDNSFLDAATVAEIEYLEENDPDFWNVFGLGQYGQRTKGIIYAGYWETLPEDAWPISFDEVVFGLDFGFNNPLALIEVGYRDGATYDRELIYQSGLTTQDLIGRPGEPGMLELLGVPRSAPIYADAAEPDRIHELQLAGYNVWPADKPSVRSSIDFVKRFRSYVHPESENLRTEYRSYKWKSTADGKLLDEPLKWRDHLMDARRYAVYSHGSKYWNEAAARVVMPSAKTKRRPSITDGYSTGYRR